MTERATLVLLGKGRMVFIPNQEIDQELATRIMRSLEQLTKEEVLSGQAGPTIAVFGMPVNVIDNS